MANIAQLINSVLSVLALISLGLLLRGVGLLKEDNGALLNKIIINVTMPALIVMAVLRSHPSLGYLLIPLVGLVAAAVCAGAAWGTGKALKMAPVLLGALFLASSIGNTGYLGYPLSQQLYGQTGLVKAFFYDTLGSMIFLMTAGLFFAQRYGDHGTKVNALKEIVTFPPLVSMAVAFALKVGLGAAGVALPVFIVRSLDYLAGATVPLIMISIGLQLHLGHVARYKMPILLTCVLKLGLAPLIALAVGKLMALPPSTLGVTVLQASMPPAMFTSVMGLRYKLDNEFLPSAIVVATALSLVTIPAIQLLLLPR